MRGDPAKRALSPALRDALATWPTGESRTYIVGRSRERDWAREHNAPAYDAHFDAALAQGYLAADRYGVPHNWLRNRYGAGALSKPVTFIRTDKPCRPHNARGASPEYASKNPFPWGVDAHWRNIKNSKARVVRGVAKTLSGSDTDLAYRYPQQVRTRSELITIRKVLLGAFGLTQRKYDTGYVTTYLLTGELLHLLLLEMLIQPVFEQGKCVRFAPVEDAAAFEERARLLGDTTTLEARYVRYLEQRNT